jgi:dolichol kinase
LKDFAKKLKKIDKQDAKQDAKQVAKRGAKRGAKRDQKKNKNDKSEKIEPRKFSFPKFGLANSVSRSGKREEALGSPLIYLIVLTLNTLLFFRDSPVGAVVICQMAVGDGLSDVIGRRYPIKSWKFAPSKSIGGTLAFVVGAFVTTALALALLNDTDCINLYVPYYIPQILLISVLCAAVELTPFTDDNISVPTVAALAGMALF